MIIIWKTWLGWDGAPVVLPILDHLISEDAVGLVAFMLWTPAGFHFVPLLFNMYMKWLGDII